MMDKEITMFDIYTKITSIYGSTINCVYSDDNSEKMVFRIRIIELINDNSSDDSSLLKTLEENMLDKVDKRY